MTKSVGSWLDSLPRAELVELVLDLVREVDGAGDWLALQQLAESHDPAGMRDEVDAVLTPHSGSYSYGHANGYAREAQGIVDLLQDAAQQPSVELLPVIERAITLVTRTVLRADDSSGALGDLVATLLDAHALAVRGVGSNLARKDRKRIGEWLVKYRYGGKQDFFDPDIVAYAPGLGEEGVAVYREAIGRQELGRYGQYPLQRLAVLDRDAAAIVAAHGGAPSNAMVAERIVDDLSEAGLDEAALEYARIGIALPSAHRVGRLADLIVQHELGAGDPDAAMQVRQGQLDAHADADSFGRLRATATQLGRWDAVAPEAERVLRERVPWQFLNHLLGEHRDDEAWQFALAYPHAADASRRWGELCARRAKTHPADTLPVYRELVTGTLSVADKRNYIAAANQLLAMRAAAEAADESEAFEAFRIETIDANRRRPTCIDIFRRSGLA